MYILIGAATKGRKPAPLLGSRGFLRVKYFPSSAEGFPSSAEVFS